MAFCHVLIKHGQVLNRLRMSKEAEEAFLLTLKTLSTFGAYYWHRVTYSDAFA